MSKQDLFKIQSCVLKVNIHCHCDGCEQKVKKLLQKIDGVYSVKVDANEGKVVVAGDVDPSQLVKKLKRAGKHAEICGGQKGMMINENPQFQNLQLDNGKGGKDNNKSQNQKGQKGSGAGQTQQLAQVQNVKGVQDLKVPAKEQNHKSVKFMLPEEEFDASDDDFDEYDDDDDDDDEEGLSYGHSMNHNKMMPNMEDGRGPHGPPAAMMNGPAFINHKDNVGGGRKNNGSVKKGDVIDQAMLIKGKGGNYNEAKNDNNGEKKSSEKGENLNKKGDKPKGGDGIKKKKGKSENGLLGRFLGFGKKSKKVELEDATYTNKSKNQNSVGGGNKGKEGKKGEGKLVNHSKNNKHDFDFEDFDDYDDIDSPPHHKNGKTGKGNNNGKEAQMGPSPIVGNNYPMGHQRENISAVQGLPAGGGYNQGMQMQHTPYNNLQHQQYMALMMNQHQHQHQQANMNNMYPNAMMYGSPHPSMNYMPPPPMPSHPMADPVTHTFSDENVDSCSIM